MVPSFDIEGILYNYVEQITAGHLANAEVPVYDTVHSVQPIKPSGHYMAAWAEAPVYTFLHS